MPIIIKGAAQRENAAQMQQKMETKKDMQKITIGKIVNAVGLKGEVRIYSYSDRKERFEELESLILTGKNGDRTYQVENIRYQKNMVIAKLAGVDDRNGAEALKDHDVNITESQLPDLEEDTFFIKDLIGCSAADEAGGRVFGVIEDVIQNSAQDIYVIRLEQGGQAMIPAVGQFVREVDIKKKIVTIRVIPGLLPDSDDEAPEGSKGGTEA